MTQFFLTIPILHNFGVYCTQLYRFKFDSNTYVLMISICRNISFVLKGKQPENVVRNVTYM